MPPSECSPLPVCSWEHSLGLYELNLALPSWSGSPIVELTDEDDPIGLLPRDRTQLDTPFLFLLSENERDETFSVRAIHLPYGRRWATPLTLTVDEGYIMRHMALPAISDTTVAISWWEQRPNKRNQIVFLDRATGNFDQEWTLPDSLDRKNHVELLALGDSLFVCGKKEMRVFR